jgi:hypothetical protein
MKVRIKKLPQARTGYQVQGSLANDVPAMGGADYNTYIGKPRLKSSKYITAVPREEANLEAEGGETVYGDINGDGMAEHKTIKGPRHSDGGVPLNLPDDTFIYSDFRGMNIKEPEFLQMFGKGKSGKKSYTPAALAKQYDIERYRKILQDPDSDHIDRKTAELMIKNYQSKLAALALVQEAKKGFPQGMPAVAKPVTDANQYSEETFVDPSIKQFEGEIDGRIKQAEELQNTEQQDPDFAQQYAQAEEMNEGQPIAQPQDMGQPMAQYGMAMGGYDFPYDYEEKMPEAEYGMAMGVNPRNYMGRDRSPMYARGGALRTYQGDQGGSSVGATGGAGDVLDITGMTPDQANKARYAYMRKHNNQEPAGYKQNGKPVKYVPPAKKDNLTVDDLKALHQSQYAFLEKELKDPNSKIRQQYIAKYREAQGDARVYNPTNDPNNKTAKIMFDAYSKMDIKDDEIVDLLLSQKKRNDKIKETGIDMKYFTNDGNKLMTPKQMVEAGIYTDINEAKKKYDEYAKNKWTTKDEVAKAAGIQIPNRPTVAKEQLTTHAIARMQRDKKQGLYKDFTDDELFSVDQFLGAEKSRETNTGGKDESAMAKLYGDEYGTMSAVDEIAGNSTLAHGVDPNMEMGNFGPVEEEVKAKEPCPTCTRSDGSSFVPDRLADGTCPPCDEKTITPAQETKPKMWLQDRIKTAGAFTDLMSAKKYMPWAAKYDLRTPKPTFLDPTRELAANAEQANIQTQALGQFAGPQALSARASGVMGAASKNAADVLAKYNNANVNIANQFESNIANIENQEQQLNAAAQQKMYDQNTISNQQYDNTKRALRGNLMNQTVAGITNMMKTDALNQLYSQYNVDAASGGKLTFDPSKARQVKPEVSSTTYAEHVKECKQYYSTDSEVRKCVESKMGAPSDTGNDDASAVLAMYKQKGGFIYSDITYPFIL